MSECQSFAGHERAVLVGMDDRHFGVAGHLPGLGAGRDVDAAEILRQADMIFMGQRLVAEEQHQRSAMAALSSATWASGSGLVRSSPDTSPPIAGVTWVTVIVS
jgi:hypothetical protein